MEISDLALRIIIVLIPGFLTTLLFRYLSTHKDYSNFYFIVLSSVFGLSNYLVLEVLFQLLNLLKCIFVFITNGNWIIENKLFVSLWGSLVNRSFKVEPIEIYEDKSYNVPVCNLLIRAESPVRLLMAAGFV
ncbi:hypothetical protein LEP1GSC059_1189 [Leptospira noguchii serovar Panama str. CZ214]|uniref:Uncharacterized protein n=1 Tax=Leptospira noguchii serovar Panama str. CZ214 TaxID=1001595 RepID=T0FLZ9_9LEPT|nr:hypothetical protein LEP1GSC059_1189 [Leptospira noguchii serovar Panama str. CZ214]